MKSQHFEAEAINKRNNERYHRLDELKRAKPGEQMLHLIGIVQEMVNEDREQGLKIAELKDKARPAGAS